MLKPTSRRIKIVLALSVAFVLSALAPVSAAGGDGEVIVVDYVVEGNAVHVTVKNHAKKPQTAEVHVYATLEDGTQVKGFTPVTVFGGGTANTVVGFTSHVEGVDVVGIGEDSSPI